jgi:prepilin-type processing-associated H-X9-DG protein
MRHTASRSAYTWIEFVVIVIVLAVLVALLVPAIAHLREAARRSRCAGQLKGLAVAVLNYLQAQRAYPPGTICVTAPTQPSDQYDVWSEAAQTGAGYQGTGFLHRCEPYMEGEGMNLWDFHRGISSTKVRPFRNDGSGISNFELATEDISWFYCPSRRDCLRPGDIAMMLSSAGTGGGADYGGCVGRHAAFTLKTGYNLCDATMFYDPNFYPAPFKNQTDDVPEKRWGIFGRVNVSTEPKDVADGISNTIMVGELQRITTITPGSKDGWVIGGPATLFTTGAMMQCDGKTVSCTDQPDKGRLLNNGFWGSPGSDHPGGANFGIADGSVTFLQNTIDPVVFALLGSMADGEKIEVPQ